MPLNLKALSALGLILLFVVSCANPLQGNDSPSLGPATPEPAYLGKSTIDYGAGAFQVKVTSNFKYRPTVITGLGAGLQAPDGSSIAEIPYAEFRVYNSSEVLIQSGETNNLGEATFAIPSVAGTYSFRIYSRALNEKLKVSVLSDKYNNQPHVVSKAFTLTTAILAGASPYNAGTLTAEALESASSNIEGGAFNIYYNILMANDYIRAEISQPAWVAEKVSVYWRAGFNPYTYYGSNVPLSFYVPSERKLYILGGENGNVSVSDTDHFDDSVILHEYAHFLEDVYGHSDSPGGSHNGNFIIDPRLAWSEGWANYFQGAVLSVNDSVPSGAGLRWRYYVDTYGYASAGGGITIQIDLNANATSGPDIPATNEGNFREMSISRTLYKSTRNSASTVGGGIAGGGVAFSKLWTTFSGDSQSAPAQYSLRNTSAYPTPAPGLFFKLLKLNLGAANSNFNAILTQENQRADTQEYADAVSFQGGACARNIQGIQEVGLPTPGFSVPRSNQLRNNDFLLYYHNGGSNSLQLAYTPVNSTNGTPMNLDLVVYKASYVYQEDYYYLAGQSSTYIVGQSRREPALESSCSFDGSKKCESVNLGLLGAGWYMVNVKVMAWEKNGQGVYQTKLTSSVDGTVSYSLTNTAGTSFLCP